MMKIANPNDVINKMDEFRKNSLESSFNTLEICQNRAEKLMKMYWDHVVWTSEKTTSAIIDWSKIFGQGFETFQKNCESGMGKYYAGAWKMQ